MRVQLTFATALASALLLAPGLAQAQQPGSGQAFKDCEQCPELVAIPPGATPEGPVGPFAIGRFEVTWDEWEACVADGGCEAYTPDDRGWGRGRQPVINVSWLRAQSYARWLSETTGEVYRLPTSAEWRRAALAGSPGPYSWGAAEPVCEQSSPRGAVFAACADHHAHPVGSYPPNAWGLHDVHGNLYEWTADCYAPEGEPAPEPCDYRKLHGGSWGQGQRSLRVTTSVQFPEGHAHYTIGFRVAREP